MSRHSEIKDIEHRVRSSMTYHLWKDQNLSLACINCDSTEELQVHHVVELYHIILGLWKLYGDADDAVAHALAMHADDKCESVTLCKKCHEKLHPGKRISKSKKKIRIENWTTLPRVLPNKLVNHRSNEDGITLIGIQLLAGIGWHILNGKMDSKIVEFKASQICKLIGKNSAGTSFNKSFIRAMTDLKKSKVINAYHRSGPDIEIHMSQEYLKQLSDLPWFMSIDDVKTNKMPVFALKWFLGLQSGRRNYKIGKDKLIAHMSIKTSTPSFVLKSVKNACDEIPWATCDYDGKQFFTFRLKQRGAVPIWTLRSTLRESIQEGS
jgi:hypothetical protein